MAETIPAGYVSVEGFPYYIEQGHCDYVNNTWIIKPEYEEFYNNAEWINNKWVAKAEVQEFFNTHTYTPDRGWVLKSQAEKPTVITSENSGFTTGLFVNAAQYRTEKNADGTLKNANGLQNKLILDNRFDTPTLINNGSSVASYYTDAQNTAFLKYQLNGYKIQDINPINNHSSALRSGRNLIEVFDAKFGNITTNQQVFERIHDICNVGEWEIPDFSFMRIGDYLELGDIPKAASSQTRGSGYSTDYARTSYIADNTRIRIAAFDHWLHLGPSTGRNVKHHVMWGFDNIITTHRYHSANDNTVPIYNTELWRWLNGATTQTNCTETGVKSTDANCFLRELEGVVPYNLICRNAMVSMSAWVYEKIHIAAMPEVYTDEVMWEIYNGSRGTDTWNTNRRFPLYSEGNRHLMKNFNNNRYWWWLASKGDSNITFYPHHRWYNSSSMDYMDAYGINTDGGVSPFFSTC